MPLVKAICIVTPNDCKNTGNLCSSMTRPTDTAKRDIYITYNDVSQWQFYVPVTLILAVGHCDTCLVSRHNSRVRDNPKTYLSQKYIFNQFIKKKSNKVQKCFKIFIIPYLYEAQHVSSDTPPIIRSLKLHFQPLVFHT